MALLLLGLVLLVGAGAAVLLRGDFGAAALADLGLGGPGPGTPASAAVAPEVEVERLRRELKRLDREITAGTEALAADMAVWKN